MAKTRRQLRRSLGTRTIRRQNTKTPARHADGTWHVNPRPRVRLARLLKAQELEAKAETKDKS